MIVTTDTQAVSTVESITECEANSEPPPSQSSSRPTRRFVTWGVVLLSVAALCALTVLAIRFKATSRPATETAVSAAPDASTAVEPSLVQIDDQQMSSLTIEAVGNRSFLAEKVATGRIGFNEDAMTPVFSPYTGRIIRLLSKPGDAVNQGAPLFEIDTPDLVQAGQDLIAASTSVPKARTVLELATRAEDRQHRLYLNKAVALKDWEQAEADLRNAGRDLHSAESALLAARSRLRAFGKTSEEIEQIESGRQIDRVARVFSPLAGTIVARKVGPGQYVKPDSPDPLFTIADLSAVWLLADVYESDVPLIRVGQPVEVRVGAYPNESFKAHIVYIAASVDPASHRVAIRSMVENRGHKLKPEMFASFRVVTDSEIQSPAVSITAIVHDGNKTSVWVKVGGNQFARKDVSVGMEQRGYVQILSGLQSGDQVVSEGSIFIGNLSSS